MESEISSEALEWAKRLLEENAPEGGETDPEANKDVPRFQEIPPVTFADGLTLEQMERQRDAGESQERLEPADYTTEPYTDADGLRRYGQLELDKLTQNIMLVMHRDRGTGRPTKKDRREIESLMDEFFADDDDSEE